MNDTPNPPRHTPADTVIDGLDDVNELQSLRARIDDRIRRLREDGQAQLIDRFEAECERLGLNIKDICNASRRRKPRRKAGPPASQD